MQVIIKISACNEEKVPSNADVFFVTVNVEMIPDKKKFVNLGENVPGSSIIPKMFQNQDNIFKKVVF